MISDHPIGEGNVCYVCHAFIYNKSIYFIHQVTCYVYYIEDRWLHVPCWFPIMSGSTLGLQNKRFSNFVRLFQLGWSQETFQYLLRRLFFCVGRITQNLQK